MGLMALVPVMPLYIQQLGSGYSPVWASLALAAPAVTALLFSSWLGKSCDRYGYRLIVLCSLLGFAVSMVLMAASTDITAFLLGRLLLGVCGVNVALTAFACVACAQEQRGHVLGQLQGASACGSLLGPIFGGVLMDIWSIRPLLLAIALFSGLAALLAGFFLKNIVETKADSGQAAEEIEKNGSESSASWSVSSLKNTMPWKLSACLSQSAAFALVNVFVLFLASHTASSVLASTTGLIHAAAWGAGMLASPFWGKANDIGDVRRNFSVAAMVCALSIALLPVADSLWQILILRIVQGSCFVALAQSVFFSLSHLNSAHRQGASVGQTKRYLVLGQIIGPFLVAVLIPWCSPVTILWCVSALFALAAYFAWQAPELSSVRTGSARLGT